MTRQELIDLFAHFGEYFQQHTTGDRRAASHLEDLNNRFFDRIESAIREEHLHNAWFTESNVRNAIEGISYMLADEKLVQWLESYPSLPVNEPRKVGVMMAGNIPMVGFHDFLSVLISGNRFMGKASGKDERLIKLIAEVLVAIDPRIAERIHFTSDHLRSIDAVIATGSNNSSRYFNYYFRDIPHIIRRNRNGIALLNGKESREDLQKLATDVFSFFGLGCRNVTKIWIPMDFDPKSLMQVFDEWTQLGQHHSYMNNVSYQRTIYLMNNQSFLDNGFVLLREAPEIGSPVGVVYYEKYSQLEEVTQWIAQQKEAIQCVVSQEPLLSESVALGRTQKPEAWDYADGIDTLLFLTDLN